MGKYYSTAANPDALADTNSFALTDIDIVDFAFWFAGSITFSDVRVSDLELDTRPVNTSAARAKRVLLMQLHAAFMGVEEQ